MNDTERPRSPAANGRPDDIAEIELAFTPAWARKAPRVNQGTDFRDRDAGDAHAPGRGHRRPGPARPERDRRASPREPSRPGRFRSGPERAVSQHGSRRDEVRPPRPDPRRRMSDTAGRPAPGTDDRPATTLHVDPHPPVDIRILPEQKALGTIMRRIHASRRAFPTKEIARLFVDRPENCRVRFGLFKDQEQLPTLYTCKRCGVPALSALEIEQHLVDEHLADFYEIREVQEDPPKGVFTCVSRCGLTGAWLGPPNHHATQEKIQDILRSRAGTVDEETYRTRITLSHDEADIEAWKQQSRQKKLYKPRNAGTGGDEAKTRPDAAADESAATREPAPEPEFSGMDRASAEFRLRREIAATETATALHATCLLSTAQKTPNAGLKRAVNETWAREQRFPAGILFAVRGALRGKRMHLFRAEHSNGPEFVMSHATIPLDVDHAIPELRMILEYIADHPGCNTGEVLEALTADPALSGSAAHRSTQVNWLTEKGHLVVFYNGALARPDKHPRFQRPSSGG